MVLLLPPPNPHPQNPLLEPVPLELDEELEEELEEEVEEPLLVKEEEEDSLFWLELEPKLELDGLPEEPKKEFEAPLVLDVVLDKLEEPRPELLEEPKVELDPRLELDDPKFDPRLEELDPVPLLDPNLFWVELEELGLFCDPNDDDEEDDDDPNPVEDCLLKPVPEELDPNDDEDEPWLLDPSLFSVEDPRLLLDPKLEEPSPLEDCLLKPELLEPKPVLVFVDPKGEELEDEEEPKLLRLNWPSPPDELGKLGLEELEPQGEPGWRLKRPPVLGMHDKLRCLSCSFMCSSCEFFSFTLLSRTSISPFSLSFSFSSFSFSSSCRS